MKVTAVSNPNINDLLNLGPKSTHWLATINIHTRQDLAAVGIVPAYCLLKAQDYPVSLNLLYALYGALHDMPWNRVPPEIKASLQAEVEAFHFG